MCEKRLTSLEESYNHANMHLICVLSSILGSDGITKYNLRILNSMRELSKRALIRES